MLAEAAGFAILAALTPTALLVAAVFLGTADPHRTVLFYLAGAIVMTGVMAAIAFVVLRAGQLYLPRNHQARYEVRLGLGVGCLLAAAYLLRRGARKRDPAKQGQGLISRMAARPGHKAAFIVGLLVYTPSVTFIAAVQVLVANARARDSHRRARRRRPATGGQRHTRPDRPGLTSKRPASGELPAGLHAHASH